MFGRHSIRPVLNGLGVVLVVFLVTTLATNLGFSIQQMFGVWYGVWIIGFFLAGYATATYASLYPLAHSLLTGCLLGLANIAPSVVFGATRDLSALTVTAAIPLLVTTFGGTIWSITHRADS